MGSIPIVSTKSPQVSGGTCNGNSCECSGRAHHVPKGGERQRAPAVPQERGGDANIVVSFASRFESFVDFCSPRRV